MRNISFALTTKQVRRRQKTVTRRIGWKTIKPGTLLQPVVKGQGLKKGEKVEKIGGPIEVIGVQRERLNALLDGSEWACSEVVDEGFSDLSAAEFVEMFCRHNSVRPSDRVTRIAFRYVD